VLCVRWCLSFKLSFRDLVAMMNEPSIGLAHTTILRWVQHYTPEFESDGSDTGAPLAGPGDG
jgi:transposase-like protein